MTAPSDPIDIEERGHVLCLTCVAVVVPPHRHDTVPLGGLEERLDAWAISTPTIDLWQTAIKTDLRKAAQTIHDLRAEWDKCAHVDEVLSLERDARTRAGAENARLREALRDSDTALRKMLDEHNPLGQHESGEIEYCVLPACAEAIKALDVNRPLLSPTGKPLPSEYRECAVCGDRFLGDADFDEHRAAKGHNYSGGRASGPRACPRCGEDWSAWDGDDRINHAREHADNDDSPASKEPTCPSCGVERADYEGEPAKWLPTCPNCGSSLRPTSEEPTCERCGGPVIHALHRTACYCSDCGNDPHVAAAPPAKEENR